MNRPKYINPFTDFGFKLLFGEEPNKDLLIDFLNQLLKDEQGTITDLSYMKNEQLGRSEFDRRAIFDLYCINDKQEHFIVEMQKAKQKFFKDRSLFYATFPIRNQVKSGDWDFELKAVYTIGILDFIFDEDLQEPEKFKYNIKLTDINTNRIFYDKLTFIYLEMPKFSKTEDELENRFDKWLYVLKNLERLDRMPAKLRERVFEKLFEVAEIAKFSSEQIEQYEESLKVYRDLKNVLDTAAEEALNKGRALGKAEGKTERNIEIARELKKMNVATDIISKSTGLSAEDIDKL
jgi:predicted transposase/invertase (TIGR01784 family)